MKRVIALSLLAGVVVLGGTKIVSSQTGDETIEVPVAEELPVLPPGLINENVDPNVSTWEIPRNDRIWTVSVPSNVRDEYDPERNTWATKYSPDHHQIQDQLPVMQWCTNVDMNRSFPCWDPGAGPSPGNPVVGNPNVGQNAILAARFCGPGTGSWPCVPTPPNTPEEIHSSVISGCEGRAGYWACIAVKMLLAQSNRFPPGMGCSSTSSTGACTFVGTGEAGRGGYYFAIPSPEQGTFCEITDSSGSVLHRSEHTSFPVAPLTWTAGATYTVKASGDASCSAGT